MILQKAADRVQTDRRDARKLAEDLRAGSLTPVHLPTAEEEAFRDLVRAREATVEDGRSLAVRPPHRYDALRHSVAIAPLRNSGVPSASVRQ